jgi:cytochrome c556
MKPTLMIAAALAVGLAGLARADAPAPAPAQAMAAPDIVSARQAAYGLSSVVFGGMRPVIEAGGDVKPLTRGARMIARWARSMPVMFPAGSNVGKTGATPAVWSDRPGFEAAAARYAEAASKLAVLAAANDREGFAAQYKVVGETCDACHKVYRLPEQH